MANEFHDGVSRESFRELPDSNKLDILFDYTCNIDNRLSAIEHKRFPNKILQMFGSVVGGFVAAFIFFAGKIKFWD